LAELTGIGYATIKTLLRASVVKFGAAAFFSENFRLPLLSLTLLATKNRHESTS
jgi:hypothetical protein